jgi:hypothetical protein
MTARILRASLPILLCAAGFGLVTYGVLGRVVPVAQDREVEKPISELEAEGPENPFEPPQDPFGPPHDPFGPPADPWGPPSGPPIPKTVKVLEREINDEHEPRLILDVTRDGLARLDSGEIIRTYHPGEAPALCPT